MKDLIQLVGDVPFSSVIIFIAAVGYLYKQGKAVYEYITKGYRERSEKDSLLQKIVEDLNALKTEQVKLRTSVDNLSMQQSELCLRQNEIEVKERARMANNLRDRLIESYRFYTSPQKNPSKQWTELERDSFMSIFADYEELGGNGFMHSEVLPAMQKLSVVPMSDTEGMNELAHNRG